MMTYLLHDCVRNSTLHNVMPEMEEEALTSLLEQPMWCDIPFEAPDTPFEWNGEVENDSLKSPYEFFKALITDAMIETVVKQTNMYALQKSGQELKTTKKEIELFIGLYLRMGKIQANTVVAYWESDSRHPPVADHMARNRFTTLASHIHLVDNETVKNDEKEDRLWKVRPWIEMHRANLELIRPAQNQSVDEVMVPFKGRSHLKQFMRNKPHRWGFKLWARTGSDGILHDWDVYQGSANKNPKDKSPLGLSGEVDMKMAEKLPQGKNFKIYADNFFSSLQLVKELKEKSIWYVGTVRENRLKGCSLKPEKELKKQARGSYHALVEAGSNITVVRWLDNRKVDLISSCSGVDPVSTASRYDRKEKEIVPIPCPNIVKDYNKNMGGVDLLDSLTSLYKYPIKSRRWYMYIFYHTISMSVVTAWLWHRRHCALRKEKSLKLCDFQSQVPQCLVLIQRQPGRPSASPVSVLPATQRQQAPERAPAPDVR